MTMAALLICNCAVAQSHIMKVVDELEKEGLTASKTIRRDPATKQIAFVWYTFTFYSKGGKYAEKLKEAFRKDAEDAVTETIQGITHTLYFQGGDYYCLKVSKAKDKEGSPRVELTIYQKGDKAGNDHSAIGSMDMLGGLRSLESLQAAGEMRLASLEGLQNVREMRFASLEGLQSVQEMRQNQMESLRDVQQQLDMARSAAKQHKEVAKSGKAGKENKKASKQNKKASKENKKADKQRKFAEKELKRAV